jgi:hypothetical protein
MRRRRTLRACNGAYTTPFSLFTPLPLTRHRRSPDLVQQKGFRARTLLQVFSPVPHCAQVRCRKAGCETARLARGRASSLPLQCAQCAWVQCVGATLLAREERSCAVSAPLFESGCCIRLKRFGAGTGTGIATTSCSSSSLGSGYRRRACTFWWGCWSTSRRRSSQKHTSRPNTPVRAHARS